MMHAEAVGRSLLARQLARRARASCRAPAGARMSASYRVGDVRLRDDEEVHRRLRPHVVESEHFLVLVDLFRGNLAADDLAEYAIRIARHAFWRLSRPARRCLRAGAARRARRPGRGRAAPADHAVEPQVGSLAHEVQAIAALRREHGLGRFLADLLEHRVFALATGASPRTKSSGPPPCGRSMSAAMRSRVSASPVFIFCR